MLTDEPSGTVALGGYLPDGEPFSGSGTLARLHFRLIPGALAPQLTLRELATVDAAGDLITAVLAPGAATVHLVPQTYVLEQNFPNPFNPQTEIRFQLPSSAPVSLRVYDILGQQVAVLVTGNLPAGYHRVAWDARNAQGQAAASGVYFYVLETDTFRQTRKLLLLR